MEPSKKELVETLIRGRNSAKKLQNLLTQKANEDELVSVDDIVTEITQSFYGGLLLLNSFSSSKLIGFSGDKTKEVYDRKTRSPATKGRRGCYKRRVTADSRMEFSSTTEDGYTWRKYGQKDILNSKFPRCYFRCTHKHVHGCKALKQVQKLEEESSMYHILYFGDHTCPPANTSSDHHHHHGDDDDELDCKRSQKNHSCLPNNINPKTVTDDYCINPSPKLENMYVSRNCNSSGNGDQSSPADHLVWEEVLQNEFEYFKNDGCFRDVSFDNIFFP